MTGWYSAQELAGLPGMPGTERRVRSRLEKFLPIARAKERGKGLEYPRHCLPAATQNALLLREEGQLAVSSASTFPAATPKVAVATRNVAPSLASLAAPDSGQLDTERARERILDFIVAYAGSVQAAIDHLNVHHHDGTLPGPLAWAYACTARS